MSEVTEEKGGKSAKTPTLITPAFAMSSIASARAASGVALMPRPNRSANAAMDFRSLEGMDVSFLQSTYQTGQDARRPMRLSVVARKTNVSTWPWIATNGTSGDLLAMEILEST